VRPPHLLVLIACVSNPLAAQRTTVDVSAAYSMYTIFQSMHDGASKDLVSRALDSMLATRAYQTMFHHYNRSWRPNHLPPLVFKRMILSLQFPAEYSAGENQRADQMLPDWRRFYADLPLYNANLDQLGRANLSALIEDGVRDAKGWLSPDWAIPDFYLPIIPSGGSRAFSIDTAQGYDFFQLPRDSSGAIRFDELRSTVAHETHHLGVRSMQPAAANQRDAVALEFLTALMPEGTASKFVNNAPGGCVPAIDNKRRDPAYSPEVAEWWTRYTSQESELFRRLVTTFERTRSGAFTRDSLQAELGAYWLAGYVSPVYFVGAELFGAVYHAYGKEGAFAAMRDPGKLLPMYDDALKKRPDLLGTCYVLPDSTVKHARAMMSAR
jgi:hypothetical protein